MTLYPVSTADGSLTLYNERFNEHYHSLKGALAESMHVFIKHGLHYTLPEVEGAIEIFEVGFGTGLNALLTLKEAMITGRKIKYTAIENTPVPENIYNQLNYARITGMEEAVYKNLMQAPWDERTSIHENFKLLKLYGNLEHLTPSPSRYHLIFFDAFAPQRQPELWEIEIMKKMFHILKGGGILVTYCAQSNFKRQLKTAGFKVEKLPGAPGKREMTRAIKPLYF